MEMWDIYDKDKVNTKRTMGRGDPFEPGAYHIVVHVVIFNSKNQMLIQRRQLCKSGWAGLWDITAGGSSVAGETSHESAERELFEELGYKVDLSEKIPSLTIDSVTTFDDIYIIERDVDLDTLKLQSDEVMDVAWASADEINRMVKEEKFVPYLESYINLLFDMRNFHGGLK